MTPHYEDESVTLYHGDCLDVLRQLPDNSIDAVCTDPPYGLEFMGKDWDAPWRDNGRWNDKPHGDDNRRPTDETGRSTGLSRWTSPRPQYVAGVGFQQWCEQWAAECLRVLKPGGHMLAFGGTRTWHRLACAVEDAGFEVRDSIAWLYGSGFPKSLDVSKAVDAYELTGGKSNGRAIREATAQRDVIGSKLGRPGESAGRKQGSAFGDKGAAQRGESRAAREARGIGKTAHDGRTDLDITAPATPAAQQWQGWGTALKPSHEPVVVARKPLVNGGILAEIGSHLDRLENTWRAQVAASGTPTGEAGGSPAQTDTLPSESEIVTSLNTVSSWRACWVEICSALSTSTTATTSSTTTDLRTLSSCLSRITPDTMLTPATSPPGLTSIASAADALFTSVVCGLRATLALSATEPATGSTPPEPRDAAGASAFEPVVVARKPLSGTVAANVLAHGTGALNVDGCRVPGAVPSVPQPTFSREMTAGFGASEGRNGAMSSNTAGRWPTNVVLDGVAAAELDEQSGTSKDGVATNRRRDSAELASSEGWGYRKQTEDKGYGGEGGASRFFPVFRYQAKAPTRERVKVGDVAHPTVKPLALMRWLVRLVTPPGGVVLDPFAGSGTTIEAAILEGFRVIGIEREADYLPLIEARIARNRTTTETPTAIAEALALFDIEEPA